LRGTAFGIYDLAIGATTFIASSVAGALWAVGGVQMAFSFSGIIAVAAMLSPLL
jgi:hypothetical protein